MNAELASRGEEARKRAAALYEERHGERLELVPEPVRRHYDTRGVDAYCFSADGRLKLVDMKNNHRSYVYQYSRSAGVATLANPYSPRCMTTDVFVSSEDGELVELTMPEYWAKFYVERPDRLLRDELRPSGLASLEGECTAKEYRRRAAEVEALLGEYLIGGARVVRYEHHPEWDYKLIVELNG